MQRVFVLLFQNNGVAWAFSAFINSLFWYEARINLVDLCDFNYHSINHGVVMEEVYNGREKKTVVQLTVIELTVI